MTSSDAKLEKVETHFKALSSVASSLNIASDELTRVVGVLDEALKKLNVGLTAWVSFVRWTCAPDEYDEEQIGYSKVDGKWGIAIRRIWGDNTAGEGNIQGPWLFNDAPREMRLRAVDKIPEMIEALSSEADKTTKSVEEKTEEVRKLAAVIAKIANEPSRAERPKRTTKRSTAGFSQEQLSAILAGVHRQQRFLGELLEGASRWELSGSDLRICFPADKQPFAEMLNGREVLSKVSTVAKEVLGYPVQVLVKLEPPVVIGSATANDKGGK